MYFFAFPLLLLVASTTCASPVHIESRGSAQVIMKIYETNTETIKKIFKIKKDPMSWVSQAFNDMKSITISEWSDNTDTVVERVGLDQGHLGKKSIIKKVDLRAVPVPQDVFKEVRNNERASLLQGWHMAAENKDGKKKVFVYIAIQHPGLPADKSGLLADQLNKARQSCVEHLKTHKLILDDAHNQNKFFGFLPPDKDSPDPVASPLMLRNAKLIE